MYEQLLSVNGVAVVRNYCERHFPDLDVKPGRARSFMVIFVRFVAALLCGILVPQRVSAHGSMDQQIAYASSEIADHPGSARRYLARAELHRIHKDWYAALADLKQAESLDADLQFVQLSRGKLYAEQGLLVAAHRALSAFVEKQPESTDGLITLARVLVQQGENEQSVAIFDRAIRSTPQPAPDYYLEVARACAACGPDHLPQAIRRRCTSGAAARARSHGRRLRNGGTGFRRRPRAC